MDGVIQINDDNFDMVKEMHSEFLVMFTSDECIECKNYDSMVANLNERMKNEENGIPVAIINLSNSTTIKDKFKI